MLTFKNIRQILIIEPSWNMSKTDQIIHLIHYLQCLPVKILSQDGVEADDIIAFLSKELTQDKKNKVYLVSADNDFLQLVDENILMYRSVEKEFVTSKDVKTKYGVHPHNFLIYKTLMGDASDALPGIKGLGEKSLFKLFPELSTHDLTFEDILDISEEKMDKHVIYARILHDIEMLENKYKIMDLSNPMMTLEDKEYVDAFIKHTELELHPKEFLKMYEEDQIGGLIRNPEFWIKDTFQSLVTLK